MLNRFFATLLRVNSWRMFRTWLGAYLMEAGLHVMGDSITRRHLMWAIDVGMNNAEQELEGIESLVKYK